MSDTASKSAPYVPQTTAASERLAGTIANRHTGGTGARSERSSRIADRVVAGYLGEHKGAAADDASRPQSGGRSGQPTASRESAEVPAQPKMLMSAGWQEPELVRAGLRTRQAADGAGPLWGILPAVRLDQVVAALETALGTPAAAAAVAQPPSAAQRSANLTLLQSERRSSGPSKPTDSPDREAGESSSEASQAARNASARLLDALRTHAAAHATAGDDRVTLGDMTLIAFADSNKRLAASITDLPHPKEADSAVGSVANYKIKSDQYGTLLKITEVANKLLDEDDADDKTADSRFGGS